MNQYRSRRLWVEDLELRRHLTLPVLKDINTLTQNAEPSSIEVWGDRIAFVATTTATGQELFLTGPGGNGASLVPEVMPGPTSSWPSTLTPLGSKILFLTRDGITPQNTLYAYESGAASPVALASNLNVQWIAGTQTPQFPIVDGLAYFVAKDGGGSTGIYRTDGTPQGTSRVRGVWSAPSLTALGARYSTSAPMRLFPVRI